MEEGSQSFNADGILAMIQRRIEALNLRPFNPYYELFPTSYSAENNFSYFSSDFLYNIHGESESSNGSHNHAHSTGYIHVAPCDDDAEELRYMARNVAARLRKSDEFVPRILDLIMHEDGSKKLANIANKLERYEGYKQEALIIAIAQAGDVLVQAAKDENGVKSVYALIDIVKTSEELCEYVTSALNEEAFELMKHPNGSKVVLHCLENLEREQNKFLFDAAAANGFELAKSEVGRVCLYECIIKSGYPYRQRILNAIVDQSGALAGHSEGNDRLQDVLALDEGEVSKAICSLLEDHLEELNYVIIAENGFLP